MVLFFYYYLSFIKRNAKEKLLLLLLKPKLHTNTLSPAVNELIKTKSSYYSDTHTTSVPSDKTQTKIKSYLVGKESRYHESSGSQARKLVLFVKFVSFYELLPYRVEKCRPPSQPPAQSSVESNPFLPEPR